MCSASARSGFIVSAPIRIGTLPSLAHRRGMEQLDQMLAVEEVSRVLSPTAPVIEPNLGFYRPAAYSNAL